MSVFPGAAYDGEGRSLQAGVADLTQPLLDEHPHSSLVALDEDIAPVGRVWLLQDTARFSDLHPVIVTEAIALLFDGFGIVVLATSAEAEASIRDGLLNALDLAVASHEAAGHA